MLRKFSDTDKLGLKEGSPRGASLCTSMQQQTNQFGGQEKQLSSPETSSVRVSVIQKPAGTQEYYKIVISDKITLVLEPPVSKQLAVAA